MSQSSTSPTATVRYGDSTAARAAGPRGTRRVGRRFAVGAVAVLSVATLALTACSSSKKTTGGAAASTGASTSAAAARVPISEVSGLLVGPNGHTLYVNNVDSMTAIKCTGDCVEEWPPLIGTPSVTGTLQPTDFATTARPDGSMQVTFQGHPLYYFADDMAAGQAKGNVTEDGISWHSAGASVVSTTGGVTTAPASSPSASGGSGGNGY
jgi:predicted lipoprotein with Yx(FWY)xxD motif